MVLQSQSNTIKLINKQPLYKVVQEEIKSYIVRHELKPGDPIPNEMELIRMFGVSRTVIREAVKSLEALSILEVRAGSGLFLRNFSFDPIFDHLAYRYYARSSGTEGFARNSFSY
jgi:DNA-binding FadR family transcriptional regulator